MRRLALSGNAQPDEAVRIRLNRKLHALAAGLFGIGVVVGLSRAVSAGNIVAGLIVLVVLGGPCFYYARELLRRDPAIVVDSEGVQGFRLRRPLLWRYVGDAHLSQRQGVFGVYHHLVFTLRREDQPFINDSLGLQTSRVPTETVEFSVDLLARPWDEIVRLVENQLGRSIPVRKQSGFRDAAAKRGHRS